MAAAIWCNKGMNWGWEQISYTFHFLSSKYYMCN